MALKRIPESLRNRPSLTLATMEEVAGKVSERDRLQRKIDAAPAEVEAMRERVKALDAEVAATLAAHPVVEPATPPPPASVS